MKNKDKSMSTLFDNTDLIHCRILTDEEYMKERGFNQIEFCARFNEPYNSYSNKKARGFDAGRIMLTNGNEYRYIETAVILGE